MKDSLVERDQAFPVLMIWVLVVLLLVQVALTELATDKHIAFMTIAAPLGTAGGTAVVYLRWNWLLLHGASAKERVWFYVATVVGAGLSLTIDHEWAMLALAFASTLSSFRAKMALGAVGAGFLGALVYVQVTWNSLGSVIATTLALGSGLILFGFTRLAIVVRQLQLAREELARSRVGEDRVRIQRELHDMLGRTLVSASLRNQVALRTLGKDEGATRQHLELMHSVISEGQARLRTLTSGPVVASLEDELESAQDLCRRIGITCAINVVDVPSGLTANCAAFVVREGLTNLLKHSHARNCTIIIEKQQGNFLVAVENDGSDREEPQVLTTGTGLTHLRNHAEQVGGTLTSAHLGDGRYRLAAVLPVEKEGPAAVDSIGRRS